MDDKYDEPGDRPDSPEDGDFTQDDDFSQYGADEAAWPASAEEPPPYPEPEQAAPEPEPEPAPQSPAAAPAAAVRPAARGLTLGGFFLALWQAVDLMRKIFVNLLFIAMVFGFFFFALLIMGMAAAAGGEGGDGVVVVPKSTALVLRPRGFIVEQLSGDPLDRAMQKAMGEEVPEALLKSLVDAVHEAKNDDRVKVLFLDLDQMLGSGLTKLEDLRAAIYDFKESGKPVIAAADSYDMARYHLASSADEIYLHQMGGVFLEGYGRYPTYYKKGLDMYGIDWHVFHVGTHKTAVEPFLLEKMSQTAKDMNETWLGDLWDAYLEDVATARNLTADEVRSAADDFNAHLAEADGDTAQMALQLGLVDHVGPRDDLRKRLIELTGEDEDAHSFYGIGYDHYLRAAHHRDPSDGQGEVAVVIASGTILNGDQPPGTIGGDSTAALIRRALHDDDVKAVVLRVDSGGGSAFASEVIRNELELVRAAGKPVVVSMGSYAASGGYWISTASDEIWASPTTITGSIGIFGFYPTFQKPLEKYLGAKVDGVGTTWMAGVRPDREMPPELGTAYKLMIERGYREFTDRVGEARGMTFTEVDEIGQGQVWSGTRALENGLVDKLGGLGDAIASAAERAGLGEGYGVKYLEKELNFGDKLLIDLLEDASVLHRPSVRGAGPVGLGSRLVRLMEEKVRMFDRFDDPMGIYAHCLCEVD